MEEMTMLGGIHELPINDENNLEINGLARFAVEEHKKKENVLLEFKRVVRARQQVVAGTMYYITLEASDGEKSGIYEAKIWEQSWINFKELQEFKPIDSQDQEKEEEETMLGGVHEEEETMLGGVHELPDCENNQEIDGLARFAIDEYNKKENSLLEFVRVVNVKHQVVAGSMYYITLEATKGGEKKIYEAKVWVKPWMNFKELEEFKPIENEKEGVPKVPGGIHEVPGGENNLEVIDLARFAIEQHNKKENVLLEFGKVVNAMKQVVAGTIYYITLEGIDCGKKKIYEAKILVKPWMNFKELLEFKLLRDAPSASKAKA